MRLLTNGVVFESIPESISLPAESGPIAVTLAGRPKEVGDLELLGFSTHTLGVKSNCRLRHMEGMLHPQYTVEVIPALPRIDVATSLPQTASFSSGDNIVTSASMSLYGGERYSLCPVMGFPSFVVRESFSRKSRESFRLNLQRRVYSDDHERRTGSPRDGRVVGAVRLRRCYRKQDI